MIKLFDKIIFDLMELFGMKPLGTKWSYLDDFNFSYLVILLFNTWETEVGKSILRIFENFEVFF